MTALLHALGLGRADVVAVAGAGGKTTLVYRLAREARDAGLRVLVTSTTHMGTLPEEITGPLLLEEDGEVGTRLGKVMKETGYATVLGRRVRPDKIEGDLMKLFPRERWIHLAHLLIHHGRAICEARRPKCAQCPIEDLCDSVDKTVPL